MAVYNGTVNPDNFPGTANADVFNDISFNDTANGAGGNDVISVDLSTDTRNINYNAVLAAGAAVMSPVAGVSIRNIEYLDTLRTGSGNDTLIITQNQFEYDTFNSDYTTDWYAGTGTDRLSVDLSSATSGTSFSRTAATTSIYTNYNNINAFDVEAVDYTGSAFRDDIYDGYANSTYSGGNGGDFFWLNYDYDLTGSVFDGGAQADGLILNLSTRTTAITVDMLSMAGPLGNTILGATLKNIEWLYGLKTGSGNDSLYLADVNIPGYSSWNANGGTDTLYMDFRNASAAMSTFWVGNYLAVYTAFGLFEAYDIETFDVYGSDFGDTLYGTPGSDVLRGGLGDDVYYLDQTTDVVVEGSGEGAADTIYSTASYDLNGIFVEILELTGTANINAFGNNSVNTLIGNSGNNSLDGRRGVDTMVGKEGNDTYYVRDAGDTVIEQTGQGTDVVKANISYTLAANVEQLILGGTSAINGTGNTQGNRLTGNDAINTLSGLNGSDVIYGRGGDDTIIGGRGADTLWGEGGADKFRFESAPLNGRDILKDFVSGTDELVFKGSDYGFAVGHVLTAAQLVMGAAPVGTGAQFYYDAATRTLYFDDDGTGVHAATALAVFDNGATPVVDDFTFV